MNALRLALDWTPNINHIGFFVALENDEYEKLGIDLLITDPSTDNYELTPAKKLENGETDIVLCPTESLISYRTKSTPFPMMSIGTVYQRDISAIAVLGSSGITSPNQLDSTHYASYEARYEDAIVAQMIKNDGGKGEFDISYPPKLDIWEGLLQGKSDATWIFLNWEALQAKARGIHIECFAMDDYQVPYSYSPMIAVNETSLKSSRDLYQKFMQASRAGFEFCAANPLEAAGILKKYLPSHDEDINLVEAIEISAKYYFDESGTWGVMKPQVVDDFLAWLKEKGLESSPLRASDVIW